MKEETIQALRHASMALKDIAPNVELDYIPRLKACAAIIDIAVDEEETE